MLSSDGGGKSSVNDRDHYLDIATNNLAFHAKKNSHVMNSTPIGGAARDQFTSPKKSKNTIDEEKTPKSGMIVLKSTPFK